MSVPLDDLKSGDTVKVTLTVDPAKPEFDQTPAEKTIVVT